MKYAVVPLVLPAACLGRKLRYVCGRNPGQAACTSADRNGSRRPPAATASQESAINGFASIRAQAVHREVRRIWECQFFATPAGHPCANVSADPVLADEQLEAPPLIRVTIRLYDDRAVFRDVVGGEKLQRVATHRGASFLSNGCHTECHRATRSPPPAIP